MIYEMRHELICSKTLRNCLDAENHVMQTELTETSSYSGGSRDDGCENSQNSEEHDDPTCAGIESSIGIHQPWRKLLSAGREKEENRVDDLDRSSIAECSDECAAGRIEVERKRRKKAKTRDDRES